MNLDSVQVCGFWAGPGNYEKRKRAFFLLKKDHFLLRFFWLVGSKNLTRCIFCGARFARLLVIFLLQTLRPAALLHQKMGAMPGPEKGIYMNAFVPLHVEGGSISNSSCDSSLSESDWPESNLNLKGVPFKRIARKQCTLRTLEINANSSSPGSNLKLKGVPFRQEANVS